MLAYRLTISVHETQSCVTVGKVSLATGDIEKHGPDENFAVFVHALCGVKARQHLDGKVMEWAFFT